MKTIASYATKKFGIEYQGFLLLFCTHRNEFNCVLRSTKLRKYAIRSLIWSYAQTLFLMTSLQYYCIPGLADIKTYAQKMQDAQVTKSLPLWFAPPPPLEKKQQLPSHCSQHFLNNDLTSCAFRIPLDIKDWINIRWLSCIAVIVTDLLTEKGKKRLTLNAPIAMKVICFSRLLKCLRSLYGKQCGPRSDCSYRSRLFWVHTVCFYSWFVSNVRQLFAAGDISRRHFQMHFFLGSFRVKMV